MSGPLVMKFGGASVADAGRFRLLADLVSSRSQEGVLVVLSALPRVTEALFSCGREATLGDEATAIAGLESLVSRHRELARDLFGGAIPAVVEGALVAALAELGAVIRGAALLGELPARGLDVLSGRGEILSSTILASLIGAAWVDARRVLRTDSRFGAARPLPDAIRVLAEEHLLPAVRPGRIAVTQGYIGSDAAGSPTTLGQGGSDYSASLFGVAIRAAEIQIWTDVEGVLTCDPRVEPEARPVEALGYDEAAELAAFGAKVLHPAAILPAADAGIPVTVRNILAPAGRFTRISKEGGSGLPVTALASRGPVTVISVRTPRMLGGSGFLSRIFEIFGRKGVSVDIVATSEVGVSLTIERTAPVEELVRELSAFSEVRVDSDRAIVALVGEQLRRTPGVTARALGALCDIDIVMISLGANEINLSLVVAASDAAEAQRRLHAAFFGEGSGKGACAEPPRNQTGNQDGKQGGSHDGMQGGAARGGKP